MSRLLAVLVVLAGCSSSPPADPPPSGAPVKIPTAGTIRGSLTMLANAGSERVFDGTFSNTGDAAPCTSEELETCTLRTCTGPSTTTVAAPFDPGTIKITSPSVGAVDLPIKDGYGRVVQPGDLKDAEEVHFVSTGGSGGGAFDLTAKAPTRVALGGFSNCAFGTLALCAVADKAPALSWSGGVKGDYVTVNISPALDGYPRLIAACSFPSEGGVAKIPASVLAKLDAKAKLTLFVSVARPAVVSGPSDREMGVTATRWLSGGRITIQLAP